MDYAELTQNSFKEALRYFEHLKSKDSVSEFEQKQLYLIIQEFLDNFLKWTSYSSASANAYQVYIKSTPLAEIIELAQPKLLIWIKSSLTTLKIS